MQSEEEENKNKNSDKKQREENKEKISATENETCSDATLVSVACKDSADSVDLRPDSAEEEETNEDVEEENSEGRNVANVKEQVDEGEEADSESDNTTKGEKKVKDDVKRPKKNKKKQKKKSKMNRTDVFLSDEPKKRSKPQPNKRKKIRKLLTEDQLQEETLQALREEEERQKRLGLFAKDDADDDKRISFKLLDADNEFPEISYDFDFMENIEMDIEPLSEEGLSIFTAPTTSTASAEQCTSAELQDTTDKLSVETISVAMETPGLHPSESTASLTSEVTRLEQLLRPEIGDTGAPPNGHCVVAETVATLQELTPLSEKAEFTAPQTSPLFSEAVNFPAPPSSGQILPTSTISSLSSSSGQTAVNASSQIFPTPSLMSQNLMFSMASTIAPPNGRIPISGFTQQSPQFMDFKASVQGKPAASSEVICISSEGSDDEIFKKQQPGGKQKPLTDTICISSGSESSDDVIFAGTDDHDIVEEDPDVNNSGMHVNDAMNLPDLDGRVLVNNNRPPEEPEIYLPSRIARIVKPHQVGGIRFMFDNIVESLEHYKKSNGFGCILAHSMGLGKTLQVISFISVFLRYTEAKTALCVVPVNTLLNWIAEFEMWLPATKDKSEETEGENTEPRTFKVRLLSDAQKTTEARAQVISAWKSEGGVLLMGYEMFRLLTNQKSRPRKKRKQKKAPLGGVIGIIDLEEENYASEITTEIYENLVSPGPDLVVCDEGHRIKNSHAGISQALKQIATRRRIVLTGYPLQNNLMEYWCMVDFVRPNFLGVKQEFSNMFERPICNGQCADSNDSDVRLMRFRSHVLHSLLKGFVQRRSHVVLRNSLAPKEEYVLLVRLSSWQKKLYNSFIKQHKEQGSGSWCSSLNPIKAFSICCKIWNHPDMLYRAVVCKTLEEQQSIDQNTLLDMDLDLPEAVMESILKKARRKKEARAEKTLEPVPGTSGKLVQGAGFSPFGDEKERGMNYDWAIDLLQDYTPNKVEFSGKMLILMQIIEHSVSVGDKILVFSQSLTTLTLIEEFLAEIDVPNPPNTPQLQRKWRRNESYFRLDGNTATSEREKLIQLFNDKGNNTTHLFLLSTRAGCLGINLVGANRVVVFDISWNPCHDAQAVCRVYRYGQTKKCVIYRLICDQTMEKKIYDRQISKQGMSDRVVDELNPIQSLGRQDVTELLVYDDEELPLPDIDECIKECNDDTLQHTCKVRGQWLTKKPYRHESLLMDCKGTRLTKAEKRLAQKGYEIEKRASNAGNYSRPSYTKFYDAAGYPPKSTAASKNGALPRSTTTMPTNRPVANVRPIQSTPYPMQIAGNLGLGPGDSQIISVLQRAGINVKKTVATHDIPLPQSSTGPHSKPLVTAGEAFYMIHGAKGLYIGTTTGRIFALRSQRNEEGNAPSPLVQGPGGQMVTPRERESQVIKTAFNTMIRRNPTARQPIRYPYLSQQPSQSGFPSNFGQSQNSGSLVDMMTGQNLGMSQQNSFLNQQRPVISHQIDLTNPQNNSMNQQRFLPLQQNPVMSQQNGNMTLQNDGERSSMTQHNVSMVASTNGPSTLQHQQMINPASQMLAPQNFAINPPLADYNMMRQQNVNVPGYGMPMGSDFLNPIWVNPNQSGGMFQPPINNSSIAQQLHGMTRQTDGMIPTQSYNNSRLDALPVDVGTIGQASNRASKDEVVTQPIDKVTQQINEVTQQILSAFRNQKASFGTIRKEGEMIQQEGAATETTSSETQNRDASMTQQN